MEITCTKAAGRQLTQWVETANSADFGRPPVVIRANNRNSRLVTHVEKLAFNADEHRKFARDRLAEYVRSGDMVHFLPETSVTVWPRTAAERRRLPGVIASTRSRRNRSGPARLRRGRGWRASLATIRAVYMQAQNARSPAIRILLVCIGVLPNASVFAFGHTICKYTCMWLRPFWPERLERLWKSRSVIWFPGVRRAGKTTICRALKDVEYFDCELPRQRREMEDPEGFLKSLLGKRVVLDEIHRLRNPLELLNSADHAGWRHGLRGHAPDCSAHARRHDHRTVAVHARVARVLSAAAAP